MSELDIVMSALAKSFASEQSRLVTVGRQTTHVRIQSWHSV